MRQTAVAESAVAGRSAVAVGSAVAASLQDLSYHAESSEATAAYCDIFNRCDTTVLPSRGEKRNHLCTRHDYMLVV